MKILRPEIEKTVKEDLRLLTTAARLADMGPFLRIKIYSMTEEFRTCVIEEIDYRNEVKNIKEFAEFKTETLRIFNVPVKINLPILYEEFSTSKVLTMEYIDCITTN